ncbi:hypothetical protein [Xanthomonas oryzae]|uniref:hypothetical protein n=1 Tax=Xanthomonas oryzae TaxID=347 RepID=UPI001F3B189F|nr:hypothetical protein [Xanthomonas oryzae]
MLIEHAQAQDLAIELFGRCIVASDDCHVVESGEHHAALPSSAGGKAADGEVCDPALRA